MARRRWIPACFLLMWLSGCPSCGNIVIDDGATRKMCNNLIDLERAGGAKAPPACYALLFPKTGSTTVMRSGRAVPVVFRQVGNDAVIEGDIVLGPAASMSGPARSTTIVSDGSPWPGGRMPVQFDSATVSVNDEATIRDALQTWSSAAGVQFPAPSQPPGDLVTFRIETPGTGPSAGGRSSLGRAGGEQFITLIAGNWDKSTVLHEVGHALGLRHEHTRPDRDDYVVFNPSAYDCKGANPTDCATERDTDFGVVPATAAFWSTDYDFTSIMQYPSNAFALPGQSTLLKKTASGTAAIPYNSVLSKGDVCGVDLLYSPDRYRSDCNPPGYPECMQTGSHLTWSCAGPIQGRTCQHVFGIREKATWGDDFVCTVGQETFTWFAENMPNQPGCVAFREPSDQDGWDSAGLCVDPPIPGLEFDIAGPNSAKECVRLFEPQDMAGTWGDNYLCWNCMPSGPRVTVSVRGFAKAATAGTCLPQVDWKVGSNEVITFDVVADDTEVNHLNVSGGFTVHCNTGSGIITGPPSIKQGEMILFDQAAGPGTPRMNASTKIEMPGYVNMCGTPTVQIGVTIEAKGASGTSWSSISLRYP